MKKHTGNSFRSSISRRDFLSGLGGLAAGAVFAAPTILRPSRARAAQAQLVVVTWGGLMEKFTRKELADPFTKEFGIPVVLAAGPDLVKVKAQIETDNPEWDVVDLVGAMAAAGSKAGYWARIDTSLVDFSNLLVKNPSDDAVRIYYYRGGVGWDSSRHPPGKHPTNFVEFFDTARFPGSRALRTRISETLEIALVASGVPPRKLYPLDVERGFRALDGIKPHVRKWVSETAQMTGLLQTKEVDFSYVYTSRVRMAQEAGVPIDVSLSQAVLGSAYYAVLKNSRNKEAAMRFINFSLRPDRQAASANVMTSVPNVRNVQSMINASVAKWVPNVNDPNHIIIDDEFWTNNFEALQARFKEWLIR